MSSTVEIKQKLNEIVQEILGVYKLDNMTMQYWEQCITNNLSTYDDFIASIYKNQNYLNIAKNVYDEVCAGFKGIGRDEFAKYMKKYPGPEATRDNAKLFVTSLPKWTDVYTQDIKDMLIYEMDSGSPDHVEYYLKKIKNELNYSFDDMSQDIQKMKHIPVEDTSIITVPVLKYTKTDTFEINNSTEIAQPFDTTFVSMFEDIFQRPIFIQEYFKYKSNNITNFDQVHMTHLHNFNRMREIYESYTGKTISEYYFVNKFLYQIDDQNCFETIIDTIVGSPDYQQSMFKILSEKYKNMFDVELEESDLIYIFEIVKNQKLDILNENIPVILTQLKIETDEIVSHIFKQYSVVLERAPDITDIQLYIQFYREKLALGYSSIDTTLENILMHTLEFHDIIKKKVREEYFQKNTSEIRPSALFDILNKVLAKLDGLTMSQVGDLVKEFL